MRRIYSVELPTFVGEQVVLAGWLHRLRRLSSVTFLILRDGRGLAQIVVSRDLASLVAAVPPESVLRVWGEVGASAQAPRGCEVVAARIEVIEPALEPPPFELHRPSVSAQLP